MSTTPASDQHMLVVEKTTKRFGKTVALDEISFSVPTGSFTVVLGPAGAGKTTTLRTIAGLDTPDGGSIVLNGANVANWEPKDRNVAMIFDNLALYPNKSGYQNIASPLVIQGEKPDVIKEKVTRLAATLQVAHVLDRLPKTMSGGEKQRIALGRALIRTPNIYLLDEPLSSLDAKLRVELRAELRRLQSDHGRTFLMATPDFNEALAIADEIVMLRHGKVVQIAPPQELYDYPVDREAALFVGSPLINLLPARYENGFILVAGAHVTAPEHVRAIMGDATREFELGLRPENFALAESGVPEGIIGELTDIEPLGLKSALTVKNGAAEFRMLVDSPATLHLTVGENITVALTNTSKMLCFDPASGQRLS